MHLDDKSTPKTDRIIARNRNSPYYFAIGTAFAVFMADVSIWLGEILVGRFSFVDKVYTLSIVAIFFSLVLAGWLYFSRILIFHEELPSGEALTFIVLFAIFLNFHMAKLNPKHWLFYFSIILVAFVVKFFHLAFIEYKRGHKDAPLFEAFMWLGFSRSIYPAVTLTLYYLNNSLADVKITLGLVRKVAVTEIVLNPTTLTIWFSTFVVWYIIFNSISKSIATSSRQLRQQIEEWVGEQPTSICGDCPIFQLMTAESAKAT